MRIAAMVSQGQNEEQKMFEVRFMKSNGGLAQSSWLHFSKIDLKW